MQQITNNVFVQTVWRGANTSFVVTSEGVVLIDVPPDIENAKKWAAEIKKRGTIRYVINTEAHHDHWITNSIFCDSIFTHEKTRELMSIMDHKFLRERANLLYTEPLDLPDNFELRLPNITFSGDLTIRLGKYTFMLMHTPGHTEGQIAVYIPEEKALFTGDTVLNRVRAPYHDAITDNRWLDSMKRLDDLDISFIVPGHGNMLYGKDFLKTQTKVVKGFLKAVQEGKTNGVRVPEEVNRTFDPFYDISPRCQKPGGVTLVPSKESKETGSHGKLIRDKS